MKTMRHHVNLALYLVFFMALAALGSLQSVRAQTIVKGATDERLPSARVVERGGNIQLNAEMLTTATLKIGVFDESRSGSYPYSGSWSFATGSVYSEARSLLLDPLNFGPGGIIKRKVEFIPFSSITEAALKPINAFIMVYTNDLRPGEGELLEKFVRGGGALLIISTGPPPLLGVKGGAITSTRYGQITAKGAASPLIKGPFGNVWMIALGANAALTSDGQGIPISTNAGGPNMLMFTPEDGFTGQGRAVIIGDEEIFMSGAVSNQYSGQMGCADNQVFFVNILAFLAGAPGYQPDPVKVISPNGGENFAGGSLISVHWTTKVELAGTGVLVELWNTQGRVAVLGYDWDSTGDKTREFCLPLVPKGSDYRIKVISAWDQKMFDVSDNGFTITGSPIRLNMPSGGEIWPSDSSQMIWWQSNPLISGTAVRFELWRAGWKVLDLGQAWDPDGEGVKMITVPSLAPGNLYKVRVISAFNPFWVDETRGTITIRNSAWRNNAVESRSWSLYR